MAKLYYGDSNNKAVEINLGGDTSDCIKKDGTTTTTGLIPFELGITTPSINSLGPNTGNMSITAQVLTLSAIRGVSINSNNKGTGDSGQVLTAKGDGTCEWEDGLSIETAASEHFAFTKIGTVVIATPLDRQKYKDTVNVTAEGSVYQGSFTAGTYDTIPAGFRPAGLSVRSFSKGITNYKSWGTLYVEFSPQGGITLNGYVYSGSSDPVDISTTLLSGFWSTSV